MVGCSVTYSCFSTCCLTCRATYHQFGDEPCVYLGLSSFQGSFLIFHNDPFDPRVFSEPWTACACDENCMAPPAQDNYIRSCQKARHSYPTCRERNLKYGLCHHFDQADIAIILSKLYLQYSPLFRITKQKTVFIGTRTVILIPYDNFRQLFESALLIWQRKWSTFFHFLLNLCRESLASLVGRLISTKRDTIFSLLLATVNDFRKKLAVPLLLKDQQIYKSIK